MIWLKTKSEFWLGLGGDEGSRRAPVEHGRPGLAWRVPIHGAAIERKGRGGEMD